MAARKQEKCITATLLRGRVYVFQNVHFMRGVATVVDDGLAAELEALCEEVTDSDGEVFEKMLFEVDYEATVPTPGDEEDAEPRVSRRRVAKRKPSGPRKRQRV